MCTFSISFQSDITTLMGKVEEEIVSKGGTFTGNQQNGHFAIRRPAKIKASYEIENQTITVVITRKPFIAPCSVIRSKMENLILAFDTTEEDLIA
ncbi:hypothetical protein [Aquimarina sediminis]|uniref:hypothetical protein n=1 Tax=Aquimarina sediminis TaxID=2070536 RepID=UPI000FFF27C6|nr:hypothetical protein [Aquimarina sediminis]